MELLFPVYNIKHSSVHFELQPVANHSVFFGGPSVDLIGLAYFVRFFGKEEKHNNEWRYELHSNGSPLGWDTYNLYHVARAVFRTDKRTFVTMYTVSCVDKGCTMIHGNIPRYGPVTHHWF